MTPQTEIEENKILNRPEESNLSPLKQIEESEMFTLDSTEKCDESCNLGHFKDLCKLAKKHWSILLKTFLICNILLAVAAICVVVYLNKPAENSVQVVQQQYENQKKLLQDIGCSPKAQVKNMLSLLNEKDDIGLGDYEIEERFIVIFQCNDDTSFCGICKCEPTENGQKNATAIIKFRNRHTKNPEWQYIHRILNIKNHTECVANAV